MLCKNQLGRVAGAKNEKLCFDPEISTKSHQNPKIQKPH